MALKDGQIATDSLSQHAVIFETHTQENDRVAFERALLELQARIINAALPHKDRYGYSAIYMNTEGNCTAVPLEPEALTLPLIDNSRPVAITKWIRPLQREGVAAVNIFTQLVSGAEKITHRMCVADTDPRFSYIVSSEALTTDAIDRLIFRDVLLYLEPTNTIAAENAVIQVA